MRFFACWNFLNFSFVGFFFHPHNIFSPFSNRFQSPGREKLRQRRQQRTEPRIWTEPEPELKPGPSPDATSPELVGLDSLGALDQLFARLDLGIDLGGLCPQVQHDAKAKDRSLDGGPRLQPLTESLRTAFVRNKPSIEQKVSFKFLLPTMCYFYGLY